MSENTNELSSCFMLATNIESPISFGAIFDDEDLIGTGVELDSHITILYAKDKRLPRKNIIPLLQECDKKNLDDLMNLCKKGEDGAKMVLDYFDLDQFENDTDFIILKLKEDTKLFHILESLNSNLREKFKVISDFTTYQPHITLAEVKKGKGGKYVNHLGLESVLKETMFSLDDLTLSYSRGLTYNLTTFNAVDRFFRLERLKNWDKELKSAN